MAHKQTYMDAASKVKISWGFLELAYAISRESPTCGFSSRRHLVNRKNAEQILPVSQIKKDFQPNKITEGEDMFHQLENQYAVKEQSCFEIEFFVGVK